MTWTQHIVAVLTKEGAEFERLQSILKEADQWARKEFKKKSKLWNR